MVQNKQQAKKKKIIRIPYFVVYTWLVQKIKKNGVCYFIMLTNAKCLIPHSDRKDVQLWASKKAKTIVATFVWRNANFSHINYTRRVLNELDNVSKCKWILKTATDITSSLIWWFCSNRLWLISLRTIRVRWCSGLNSLT